MLTVCPVCSSAKNEKVFSIRNIPVNVCVQWDTREEALNCPKGNIKLRFCEDCGYVWNEAFDPERSDYSSSYENSLFYSPVYREYTNDLINHLMQKFHIQGKTVMDIGCGKGDFLKFFCEAGANRGIGFDTSFEDGRTKMPDTVTVVKDMYSEKYANHHADIVCSRYVFEHVAEPVNFLENIHSSINGSDSIIYFEVPNIYTILKDDSMWDIIYEHYSYFSKASLENIFRKCGFEVLDIYDGFGSQFLGIEAKLSEQRSDSGIKNKAEVINLRNDVMNFFLQNEKTFREWERWKELINMDSAKVVLWGAGAKGINFLNMTGIKDEIRYLVDINPNKQGKYAPGTGQKIVSVDFLRDYRPDIVLLSNPIYQEEIVAELKARGIQSNLMSIRGSGR